jgi:cytochrome b6-f complex iron-sulfur subunit|tara:strand:+ start:2218 stop:2790 length:573 start_codon:yes stop_codon:yes gene_type:complete
MPKATDKKTVSISPSSPPPAALNKAEAGSEVSRRSFFSWLSIGWVAFIAATGGYFTMMLRFFFPNVLFEPVQTFRAGFPDDYTKGEVDLRWKDKFGVWMVRNDEGIYALSTTCTHLGCTPNWQPTAKKFKCPCHGSGFRITGIHFEGPAPRPLERFKITLADDGEIIVDKNQKYQQEKGQWSDSEAFLKV